MKTWLSLSLLLNILGIAGIVGLVWWMGGISNLWNRITNRGLSQEYFMLKDQYAKLPSDSTDILLLGNSLTYGGAWSEWLSPHKVANRGIPGDGIEGVQERMADYIPLQPKLIIVMIGINDLAYHPKEWLLTKYPIFLKQLQRDFSSTKIVLQSILPVNNNVLNTGLSNIDIDAVNAELVKLCSEAEIEYLALAKGFKNDQGQLLKDWTADGLHLNGKGYQHWADQLNSYLKTQTTR